MDQIQDKQNQPQITPAPFNPPRSRRKLLPLLILLVAISVVLGFLLIRNDNDKDIPKELIAGSISIVDDGFSPKTIKINKGDSITWTNSSSGQHQIASDPHPAHDTLTGLFSEPLQPGDTYTYPFEEAGTYTYHDHLDPFSLQATVIVE